MVGTVAGEFGDDDRDSQDQRDDRRDGSVTHDRFLALPLGSARTSGAIAAFGLGLLFAVALVDAVRAFDVLAGEGASAFGAGAVHAGAGVVLAGAVDGVAAAGLSSLM